MSAVVSAAVSSSMTAAVTAAVSKSDYKIKSEWHMGKKFRGYAGVMSDK